MTSETPEGGSAGGVLEHLRELAVGGLAYLQARLALAGIEAREALVHFGIILGFLALAMAVILYGYLFLFIAACVLIAQLAHISPGWVILGLAVLHFLVAGVSILIALSRLKKAVFSATLAELKKDQQWLNQE